MAKTKRPAEVTIIAILTIYTGIVTLISAILFVVETTAAYGNFRK
jgi:hypothetical protein